MKTTYSKKNNVLEDRSTFYLLILAIVMIGLTIIGMITLPVSGCDGWNHLNWLSQYPKLVHNFTYPKWMLHSFGGYGAPSFYFYPPLSYWMATLFSFTG